MSKTNIELENGTYTIHLQTLKKDAEEESAMANYLSQVAVITKDNTFLTIALLFQSEKTITGFQVERRPNEFVEAIDRHVNDEMERRSELFELDELPMNLRARVQYEVEHEGGTFKGDEVLRLSFDPSSIEKVESNQE